MVCENLKRVDPLLPDRYPIGDFFICDIADAMPKSDYGSMEHPFYSLSTRPDLRIREYEHNDVQVTVTPSVLGRATMHDKDVLIYCISQLMAKVNAGVAPQQTLHVKAYDLLKATNRRTDGQAYNQLTAAFERLSGTRIKTNIRANGEEIREGFGLIDSWRMVRHESGRMSVVRVNLSDWMFNAVLGAEVLTLSREYFRLRKPIERRLYELGRKHCGAQPEWSISLELLAKKCGSTSNPKNFRRSIVDIVRDDERHQHMPDYALSFDGNGILTFRRRRDVSLEIAATERVRLKTETLEAARVVVPGYDIYLIESEWRAWMQEMQLPIPRNPDAAFLGFCRKWLELRGSPV